MADVLLQGLLGAVAVHADDRPAAAHIGKVSGHGVIFVILKVLAVAERERRLWRHIAKVTLLLPARGGNGDLRVGKGGGRGWHRMCKSKTLPVPESRARQ